MDYEQYLVPLPSDVHRFFPEWADRPQSADPLIEADHNSYLAGGYSEEFGYRIRADLPASVQSLEGDPDQSRQWAVQIGGLHPGYPECPRPIDRGVPGWELGPRRSGAPADRSARREGVGGFVRVDRSGADRRIAFLPVPIGALWSRLRIRARYRAYPSR